MSEEIKTLQRELDELGFKLVGPATGEMNLQTEMALREFQRYAKLTRVAQEGPLNASPNYSERLSAVQVPATHLYRGAIHGKLDAETKTLIAYWKSNRFRCPLVVHARRKNKNGVYVPVKEAENLWLHDDKKEFISDANVRIFARDYSGYYDVPPEYIDPTNQTIVLGYYEPNPKTNGRFNGPNTLSKEQRHTRPISEILPDNLIGKSLAELTESEKSSYKVVRVISEIECEGYYDVVNCYDRAFVSLGPCHWTLGILDISVQPNRLDKGELGAYLAYLASKDAAAFEKAIGFWGVKFEDWGTNGKNLFIPPLRKYVSTIKHQKENGDFEEVRRDEQHWNYFKTWHWFYRFQAAARSIVPFRRRMWDMTRIRLRDILETPWKKGELPSKWGTKQIKDIFTSELATTMLLRWHVFRPSDVIKDEQSGIELFSILQKAGLLSPDNPPESWGDCQENLLIEAILSHVKGKIPKSEKGVFKELFDKLEEVRKFPAWRTVNPRRYRLDPRIEKLSRARSSFKLHKDNELEKPSFSKENSFSFSDAPIVEILADESLLSTLTTERPIVRAYVGNKEVYEALWNGETIRGNLKFPAEARKIDRLVFFKANEETAQALFALPVLINKRDNDNDHLKINVSNPGTSRSVLTIEGKYRCFSPVRGDEHNAIKIEINQQSADGQLKVFFKTLDLNIGEVQKNFRLEDLGRKFSQTVRGGFEMSEIGNKLGLDGGHILETFSLNQTLAFINNEILDHPDSTVPLIMSIETQVATLRPNQNLIPFAVSFPGNEVSSVRSSTGTGTAHYVTITQRQPFGENWKAVREGEAHWIFETEFPHRIALELWNKLVEKPVRNSLHTVQDGRPVTFLPTFADANPKGKLWSAKFSVIDKKRTKSFDKDDVKFPAELSGALPTGELLVFGRSISPQFEDPNKGHLVEAELQGFLTMSGEPLAFTALLTQSRVIDEDTENIKSNKKVPEGNKNPGFYFRLLQTIEPAAPGGEKTQNVRVGSLNLNFYPLSSIHGTPLPSDTNSVETNLLLRAGFADNYSETQMPPISMRSARYNLQLLSAAPGGQDDVPGDEFFTDLGDDIDETDEYRRHFDRELALVVNPKKIQDSESASEPSLFLAIEERIEPKKSQTIALQIKSRSESKSTEETDEVIVIDPHPFLICKVSVSEFQKALAEGITNEIGNWTNRANVGAGWEVSAGAEGFDLILPPQTIGEAMHRSKEAKDISPGVPIDFRFSPPAQVRLRPSFYRQRFAEVPWNLRRILGYAGQRAPGAGVEKIDFELFYGLSGQITYSHLRLAEIGSRLGANPGQQFRSLPWKYSSAQKEQYEKFRNNWKTIFPSLLSRLAILEPWDEHQPQALVLNDKDGVGFELRKNAHLRYPIQGIQPPNADFNFSPDGLAGGYSWGFESNNIFQAVLRTPVSYEAQITRPLFSSLGGWGQQKALFDQGLTTISSETVMGRVSSINIERIGCISVFRNKAKHVIVYERTVTPSRQFFMEQEPLVGNPVLRKVDEYIELLEDDRPFPDYESYSKQSRGCITGCRFPSGKPPRIRVNSRWGQDVGEIGWKIPLWVRGAAPSDIYPKPDVKLMMAGKKENQQIPVGIEDPEKLYFFTLITPGTSRNTDDWASVEGVDFDALGEDFNPPAANPGNNPEDVTVSNDLPIRNGKGAFTFTLSPAPAPVNVMVDRAEESITTRLQNVTVMRGFVPNLSSTEDAKAVLNLRDTLANYLSPVLNVLPAEETPVNTQSFKFFHDAIAEPSAAALPNLDNFITEVRKGIENTRTRFIAVHNKISENVDGDAFERRIVEEIKQRFAQQLKFADAQIRFEIETFLTNFNDRVLNVVDQLKRQFPGGLTSDAKTILLARLSEISDEVDGEPSEVRRLFRSARGTIGETLALLEKTRTALDKLSNLTKSQLEDSKCEICRVQGWGEAKQSEVERILNRVRAELTEVFQQVDFLIAEIPRQWTGSRTDNVRLQLLTGIQPGDSARQLNRLDIENKIRELYYKAFQLGSASNSRDAINLELENLINVLPAFIEHAQALINIWKTKLEALGNTGFEDILDEVHEIFTGLINQGIADWDKLRQAFEGEAGKYLNTLPGLLETKIEAMRQLAEVHASALRNAFLPNVTELRNSLNEIFNPELADKIKAELEKIRNAEGAIVATSAQLREEVERVYSQTLANINDYINRAAVTIPLYNRNPSFSKDNALRLIRGFGEPPKLPNLAFSLPALGYYPFDLKDLKDKLPRELPQINLTPVMAQANQLMKDVGEQARDLLNPLEVKLPTNALFDRFKPIDLSQFDLSKIFPNFAGLNLKGLFANLRMPDLSSDRVKVTHGINPETRSGWMKANIDVPFESQPITVFSLAGVTIRLLQARFQAEAQIEIAEGKPPKQMLRGSISGDWDLQVGGFPVAVFVNCSLIFEEGGKIRFDISPDRVRLKQVLEFLTELLSKFGYSDKGFSIAVTPSGIRSLLDLPLPDVQSGAFGIANLNLSLMFALDILDGFSLRTQLSVGRRDAPFTLTVFILGGAGFFELDVFYKPLTKEIGTTVNIGIFAAASLAISAGPVKGGVYAYFGITVQYRVSNRSAGQLTLGLLLLFRGEVRVLGIVTVTLVQALEAQYTNGGGLVGRGWVSLEIKICWCVKIKVKAQIEYRFGKAKGGNSSAGNSAPHFLAATAAMDAFGATVPSADDYLNTAREYITMFD